MSAPREWVGRIVMNLPAPVRSLRNVPMIGGLVHRLSRAVLPADDKIWVRVRRGVGAGLWIKLNPRTGDGYLRGEVEPAIQSALSEHLERGMVFYDLGANIGFFSLIAARLVGETGRVFSFEPDPDVAARLRSNLERNKLSNVTVVEAGIWSEGGLRNFAPSGDLSPDRGLGRFEDQGKHSGGTLVPCISLDQFIRDAPPPDLIKCDVEGAELEVFRGAQKLLATHRPIILCEMHSEANDRYLREKFANLGYSVEVLDNAHIMFLPPTAEEA